jgi:hypothetical protein
MLRSSAISRMVNLLFQRNISFTFEIISSTFEMFSSVQEVEGRPGLSSSSIDSEPLRNRSDHLQTVLRVTAASP